MGEVYICSRKIKIKEGREREGRSKNNPQHTNPMIRVPRPGVCRDRVDKRGRILASRGTDPLQAFHFAQSIAQVLDALDDGGLVVGIVEVGGLGDDRLELVVDGQAAAGNGAGAEVLGQGHGGCMAYGGGCVS